MFSFLCISFENELKISTKRNFLTLDKDFYLTHSVLWYFEKSTLKKPPKPRNFKWSYLKDSNKFRVKAKISRKFI